MVGMLRGPAQIASFLVVVSLVVGLSGCGRYRPPLPPEYLAPAEVENLVVTPSEGAVSFTWTAADTDARGKELKSAEGFLIERKELVNRGDETNPEVRFERIGYLQDKHVEVREKLRAEARAAGKVGRTVKSPEEFTKFTFVDSKPVTGKTYLYQIVPVNQGGTEGVVGQLTKVVFQGAQSAVVPVIPEQRSKAPQLAGAAAKSGRGM